MSGPKHVGIVAVSAEGAARLGPHRHPPVSVHTHSLAEYMRAIEADRWLEAGEPVAGRFEPAARARFVAAIEALAARGCDAAVLDSTRILARAALREATGRA